MIFLDCLLEWNELKQQFLSMSKYFRKFNFPRENVIESEHFSEKSEHFSENSKYLWIKITKKKYFVIVTFRFVLISGCSLNGQTVQDGREVTLSEDPCLKCSCSSRRLTCVKKACPVLQCPPSKQIKLPGECCPKCSEKRTIKPFPGKCILGKGFYDDGKRYNPDKCSMCTCMNGTSICRRETCPVLECSPTYQKLTPGECCPHCPPVAKARSTCTYEGKTYQVSVSLKAQLSKSIEQKSMVLFSRSNLE